MKLSNVWKYVVVIIGAALIACGFNLFLVPHKLLSGGVSGLSMLVNYFTPVNLSVLYFVFNVPILVAGWFQLGKRFIVLSILSVVATTFFIAVVPVNLLASDTLLASVFGGVLVGVGTGISFRAGGSSGGFDIIGSIVTRYRDFPVGNVLVAMNGLVILAAGYFQNDWNLALASMISIFVTGKMVDFIHVSHFKVTVYIITNETEALLQKLLERPRGVTKIKTEGAFSHESKDMLMTVTTRYELQELKRIIKQTDPKAFVNIVETVGVMGSFRRS
ncbi:MULTISPECIES: YitT family protein [Paenibacillus]|uniref:Membrane protein n=1 Tax=Paenibacillus albilobatus TaxID=2716884 RepID=A0A920C9V1_9BACL|nr:MULTISPECIES: YitT family protein [Paenibacillus]GIO30253.1 membrane protein [Paenibacillus albilobatus]